MVTDLVRRQIGGSPGGQAALAAVEERPDDPEAVAALEEVVRAGVAENPAFGVQLEVALRGPQTVINTGIQIGDGAKLGRNQISIGPITVNNTPAARATLATLVAVLVAALVFGVYGVVQAGRDDGPLSQPGGSAPGGDPNAQDAASGESTGEATSTGGSGASAPDAQPLGTDEIDKVLNGLELPAGWVKGWHQEAAEGMNLSNEARMQCWDLSDPDPGENSGPGMHVSFGADGDGVMIDLTAHEASGAGTATDSAVTAMEALRGMYGCLPAAGSADIGDEAFSYTQPGYLYTWVRVGPMIAWIITADTTGRTSEAWARTLVPDVREALESP
ncbi:hypothetical protein OG782_11170 [Streptomyces sp. NBC_00876]|uniref:hypothetical protein n=1 Tax=Streptomyces sp. NBC_00876 TaxID=2975853 RepID=UPI0038697463|nr:hypothetical protein OG782_11170 [Streptomyces sp. NBC_00876]